MGEGSSQSEKLLKNKDDNEDVQFTLGLEDS